MAKINMNIPEVRKQAKLLKNASQDLTNNSVRPLEESNKRMASVWTGNTAEAFRRFSEQATQMLKSNAKDLNEIGEFLESTCREMERAEAAAKQKVSR